ncbi:MAG: glycoside hydrolase family 1 protein [Candidatus Kariarchaeaceae archaeon]
MLEEKISDLTIRIKKIKPTFLIGTAAAAHQVEGNNHNDWTEFEKGEGNIANGQVSGKACNHYELYEQDFKLLRDLGFMAHRLSIEWSRIIPKPGEIDQKEVKHYRDVLQSLKRTHQTNFVTLHHFTSPVWFIEIGGFEKRENLRYWDEYVEVVCNELGDLIDVFNTINEPYVYAAAGYFQGIHSPGKKSIRSYFKVGNNLMLAHFKAVEIIKTHFPEKKVGIVKNLIVLKAYHWWNPIDLIMRKLFDWSFNSAPLKALKKHKIPFGRYRIKNGNMGDFIGVNHYNIFTIGLGIRDIMQPYSPGETNLTSMKWGVYPKALEEVLLRAYKTIDLPIFVTENGIGTEDDDWRKQVIIEYLNNIVNAMEEGVDIRGYFYWSNLDNFEWAEGYLKGGFGLIEVNFDNFERKPKESAYMLGTIAKKIKNG